MDRGEIGNETKYFGFSVSYRAEVWLLFVF